MDRNNFQKGQKVMVLSRMSPLYRKVLTVESHSDCNGPVRFVDSDAIFYKTDLVIYDEEENVELNLKSLQPIISYYNGDK